MMHSGHIPKTWVVVHSLVSWGEVGLKPFMRELGAACLPVASCYLGAPANIPGCRRWATELVPWLANTFALQWQRENEPGLVIGYLGSLDQAASLLQWTREHRSRIPLLLVDPVCGDHGKPYVDERLIPILGEFVSMADWAFPNQTEWELLKRFRDSLGIVVGQSGPNIVRTSARELGGCGVVTEGKAHCCFFPGNKVSGDYSGTGDLFLAHWIKAFMQSSNDHDAAISAMRAVENALASRQ